MSLARGTTRRLAVALLAVVTGAAPIVAGAWNAHAQAPAPSAPAPVQKPGDAPRAPDAQEPQKPAPDGASSPRRPRKDRFIPSEEVSPDNDVPFPVDI